MQSLNTGVGFHNGKSASAATTWQGYADDLGTLAANLTSAGQTSAAAAVQKLAADATNMSKLVGEGMKTPVVGSSIVAYTSHMATIDSALANDVKPAMAYFGSC